jgi:hypothetical protein
MRVERELRALRKDPSVRVPWNRTGIEIPALLERVETYGNLCRLSKCRKSDKGFIAPYRLF